MKKNAKILVASVLLLGVLMPAAVAVVSIFGSFQTSGTGDIPKVVFQNGADGIATITGGGTGATVNIKFIASWNWTATSALYINNTDTVQHSVTVTYTTSSGQTDELDKMYSYFNNTLFFSWYSGAPQKQTETWANLPAGQRLVVQITTLGTSGAAQGHTFSITFKLSYS